MVQCVPPCARRAERSDVARNRRALLDAAKAVFADGSRGVPLDAVARRAGLGIGTLYRHFPTREALYVAVYAREIDQIVALADECLTQDDEVAALRRWLYAAIDLVETKKGLIAALALSTDTTSAISSRFTARLLDSLAPLLTRAVASGALRDAIDSEELLFALFGMCMMRTGPGWQDSVRRLADTMIAGLVNPAGLAPSAAGPVDPAAGDITW